MKKIEELKEVLDHMENRTQWHQKDVKKVEDLRNEVTAIEAGGKLTAADIERNKVVHHH